jgi:hypothetical protein
MQLPAEWPLFGGWEVNFGWPHRRDSAVDQTPRKFSWLLRVTENQGVRGLIPPLSPRALVVFTSFLHKLAAFTRANTQIAVASFAGYRSVNLIDCLKSTRPGGDALPAAEASAIAQNRTYGK